MGTEIKKIGEFGLIERLARLVPAGPGTVKGIGDDAAVLAGRKGRFLLFTTDAMVENVHFLRSAGARRIGRKALAVNLSDIAAMGGIPRWAVVNLGIPPGVSYEFCRDLYRGLAALAREFSVGIVGGDTVGSPRGLVLAVAVVGEVERKRCVLRSGARPGDVVCLTGELGAASRGKHLDFTPRIRESRFLVEHFSPTAMIDISDGFFADLEKLCRASGVGAVIHEEAIPLVRVLAGKRRPEQLRAAAAGEEFELLFTIAESQVRRLVRAFPRATRTRVTPVGRIFPARAGLRLLAGNGKTRPFPAGGYDHFRRG